jgi:hypothetical protein
MKYTKSNLKIRPIMHMITLQFKRLYPVRNVDLIIFYISDLFNELLSFSFHEHLLERKLFPSNKISLPHKGKYMVHKYRLVK